MKRLVLYVRVSDLGERDPDSARTQTTEQQREAAAAICKLSDAKVVHEVVVHNVSGGKSWPEPKLAELIRQVDAGVYDGIVVYDLARFGRHLDALKVIERWAEEGKVFLAANDKFDATTPSGRMCLRMMMVVARFYWESVRDRFAESQRKAFKRGAHIGRTPFGYERITDDTDPKVGCLIVGPRGPVVTEAFSIAAKDGLHAAMAYLNEAAPERRWLTDDVRRLLKCRTYLGEVSLNGESKRAHEPLTTLDTWTAAQTEPGSRATNGDYPLSKIVTCGTCGAGLTGQLQRVRGERYRRYRCSNPACGGGSSINADGLEAYVRAVLRPALDSQVYRVRFDIAGLDEARRALVAASDERMRFAYDVEWIAALGPEAAKANALALSAAVMQAQARYDDLLDSAARVDRLPVADELDDNEQLLRAIRSVVGSITVARGRRGGNRHAALVERVTITDLDGEPLNLDDSAGVAAA